MDFTCEPEVRKARNRHRCNWCGEFIEKGSTYENAFQVCEGQAWRSKLHMECGESMRAYHHDGEPIELHGTWQRGHSHEVDNYTVEEGVKYGCPGCIAAARKAVGGE